MKLSELIEGIKILQHYYDDPDGYHVDAQHDVILLAPTDKPLLPIDVTNIKKYGWFQEGHSEDEDFYDPDEGWMNFT
jgi:hypothetical protein